MNEQLVSIVVPIYNVEKYLQKCVDSLLNQTYSNYEIILVDDGSPDGCPQICDYYAEKYKYVHAYHKTNGGLSDARNYGTMRANGEWVIYVDSDDYVEPDYISALWSLKEKYDADIAMAWVMYESEDGRKLGKKLSFQSFCVTAKEAIWDIYGGSIHVGWNAYNKIYKKELLLQNPFPDGYYEDMACLYKILAQCNKVAIGDFNQNYHYVQRDNSILNSALSEKHFHIFKVCDGFANFIKKEMPDYSVLEPAVYAKSVLQMLRKNQIADKNDFDKIFYMYNRFFRKNLVAVLCESKIKLNFKILYLLLCTNPLLFRLCRR